MNQTPPDLSMKELEPLRPTPQWRWRWPVFGYAFAATLAAALVIPLTAVGHWIKAVIAGLWESAGFVLPVFILVSIYTLYCCVLLGKNKLNPLHIDRLQLAEHFAYSAGLLGVVVHLVALSRGAAETFDPKVLLGALAPFKIGFSLWVLVVTVRWLGEHVAGHQIKWGRA